MGDRVENGVRVRRIGEGDLPDVVAMVRELADYEHALDQCELTVGALRTALFAPAPVLFGHVALLGDGRAVGIALWFLNYSTWTGVPGIYLEDLFVRPEHRGGGAGRALLAELAAECVRNGYRRLQWSVLDWNTPSIEFYERLGAHLTPEWVGCRMTGGALTELASERQR
ncbi:MAG TPA: GNAT family N-acetyltransferase [Pseudonocardia sp.]|jgi:GNAT superfamily N-acetyltransferase